jgi:hypothetical protein
VARLRDAGFSCGFQADEKTMLWSKLALLAPFALTTTASDKDKQGVLADATCEPDSNPPWMRPALLLLRTKRLSIEEKFWLRSNHYLELREAPCRRMCQLAVCQSSTPSAAPSFALHGAMGSTCRQRANSLPEYKSA